MTVTKGTPQKFLISCSYLLDTLLVTKKGRIKSTTSAITQEDENSQFKILRTSCLNNVQMVNSVLVLQKRMIIVQLNKTMGFSH